LEKENALDERLRSNWNCYAPFHKAPGHTIFGMVIQFPLFLCEAVEEHIGTLYPINKVLQYAPGRGCPFHMS
jgi:hypothetical protein